jgi:HEPN domain-containing protein
MIHFGTTVVKTHNLQTILDLVAAHCTLPAEIAACSALTDYAVTARYPGVYEPVIQEEYEDAVEKANAVVVWAAGIVGDGFDL